MREDLSLSATQQAALRDVAIRARRSATTAVLSGLDTESAAEAAAALANDLGRELYRVDLSRVVSKYIGETEKNLARLFDDAEAGGAVLFFDEADALFGKRTDVKDAHDRYANIDVSYLIERLEAYNGLVVLASNRKGALDEAFIRRIRNLVSVPDA